MQVDQYLALYMKSFKKTFSIFFLFTVLIISMKGCSDSPTSSTEQGVITDGMVADIDGNMYVTVLIGNQMWMAENLRVTRYRDGSEIFSNLSNDAWRNTSNGAYSGYPNSEILNNPMQSDNHVVEAYGLLYNWHAVNDSRGVCPEGWSVPTDAQWSGLAEFIGGDDPPNGNKLKSRRQLLSPFGGVFDTDEHPRWVYQDEHYGTDLYGFSALPAGVRLPNGTFTWMGQIAAFWSANERSETTSWRRALTANAGSFIRAEIQKNYGKSVRCIQDEHQE